MKKNAVAATKAIEISQNEIPTKSSDSRLALADARDGAATNAAEAIISLNRPYIFPIVFPPYSSTGFSRPIERNAHSKILLSIL